MYTLCINVYNIYLSNETPEIPEISTSYLLLSSVLLQGFAKMQWIGAKFCFWYWANFDELLIIWNNQKTIGENRSFKGNKSCLIHSKFTLIHSLRFSEYSKQYFATSSNFNSHIAIPLFLRIIVSACDVFFKHPNYK